MPYTEFDYFNEHNEKEYQTETVPQDGSFFKNLDNNSSELCIRVSCPGHGLDGRYIHVKRTEYEKVYDVSIYDAEKHKVIDYKYTDSQTDVERTISNIAKAEIKKYYGNLKHCSYREITGDELESLKQNNRESMCLADKIHNLTFKERLEFMLAGQGSQYDSIYVGETPDILQKVGCGNLPILYSQGHLRAAVREKSNKEHHHGLKVETISELPVILENPVFLYDTLGSDKGKEAIIAVSDRLDDDNNPIVVVIKPNGKGQLEAEPVDSNFVVTMYGHDNISSQIEEAIKQDKLLFIDKNKSQALPAFAGLQLSRALDNSDSNGIIHPSRIIVNEIQTWLGKETSGQVHDNNVEKERLLSQAQTVSVKRNECDRDCKRVEGIVQKTFKNIKNLAERAKEKVSQTFYR